MYRVALSERLLSVLTTRERATAIVGDLLEIGAGPVGYWNAVLRTALALSWRIGLGVVFAATIEAFMVWAFNRSATAAHPVDPTAVFFGWIAALLSMTATFSAIRYGLAEPVTQVGVSLGLFAGIGVCFRWVPFITPLCGTMTASVILISSLTPQGRRALRRILAAVILAGIGGLAMLFALSTTVSLVAGVCFLVVDTALAAAAISWAGPASTGSRLA